MEHRFTSVHLTITGEGGLRNLGVDGVVLPGHPRDGSLEHGESSIGIGGSSISIIAGLVSTVLGRGLLVANGRGFLSSTSPGRVAATVGMAQAVPTHKTQGKGWNNTKVTITQENSLPWDNLPKTRAADCMVGS